MSGYEGFNYPAFDLAANWLRAFGYEVLCPTAAEQFNDTGKPQAWDWYMRHALRMVLDAGGIALLDDWQASRGARLEVDVAHGLQIPVLPLDRWIERADVSWPAAPESSIAISTLSQSEKDNK